MKFLTWDTHSARSCASQTPREARSRVGAHSGKLWPYTRNWAKSRGWALFREWAALCRETTNLAITTQLRVCVYCPNLLISFVLSACTHRGESNQWNGVKLKKCLPLPTYQSTKECAVYMWRQFSSKLKGFWLWGVHDTVYVTTSANSL